MYKLRSCILLFALALCACSEAPPPQSPPAPAVAPAGNAVKAPVIVYNWEEYIDPALIEAFEAESGIKVDYRTFDSNDQLDELLSSGQPFADVVFPSALPFAREQIRRRLFRELPTALRERLAQFDEAILRGLVRADANRNFLVPYLWGTTGLALNLPKVQAALGPETAIDSWALLFDPQLTARLRDCGIAIQAERAEILGAAMLAYDPAAFDSQLTAFVLERTLARTIEDVRYFGSSTRIIDDLVAGQTCVALAWSGDVGQAIERAEEEGKGVEISYLIPREGGLVWIDVMAVPDNAPNPDRGFKFIKFMMRAESLAKATNFVHYANALPAADGLVMAELRDSAIVYPDARTRERLYGLPTVAESDRAARDAAFDGLVLASGKWETDE